MEEAGSGLGLSMSVSNSYLIGQASLTTPTVSPPTTLTPSLPSSTPAWVLCGPGVAWPVSAPYVVQSAHLSLPPLRSWCGHRSRVGGLVAVWSLIVFINPSMCAFCFDSVILLCCLFFTEALHMVWFYVCFSVVMSVCSHLLWFCSASGKPRCLFVCWTEAFLHVTGNSLTLFLFSLCLRAAGSVRLQIVCISLNRYQ